MDVRARRPLARVSKVVLGGGIIVRERARPALRRMRTGWWYHHGRDLARALRFG